MTEEKRPGGDTKVMISVSQLACLGFCFDLCFISETSHLTCDIHHPRRDNEPLSITYGLSKLGDSICSFFDCLTFATISVGRPCSVFLVSEIKAS